MAVNLTTHLKGKLDTVLGSSGADKIKSLINSSHTPLDQTARSKLEGILGSIGEAAAFAAACTANTAAATLRLRTGMMNALEHHLGGRGHAEELIIAIADGTIT